MQQPQCAEGRQQGTEGEQQGTEEQQSAEGKMDGCGGDPTS